VDNSRTEEATFEEGIQDYLEAFNAGDYRRVASYWTEDAVHQPPMGPEIRGRAALGEFYRQSSEAAGGRTSPPTTRQYLVHTQWIYRTGAVRRARRTASLNQNDRSA